VCQRLPTNHPLQPPFIQPLQTIPGDVEFASEQAKPESDIPETSTSSQSKPSSQISDPSVLEELANHYKGELPDFEPNLEIASKIVPDMPVSESSQQHQPNLEMAINTYSELIIHPKFKPYHLNATHSNISFNIALRKIANKRSSFHEQSISDNNPSLLGEPTFVVQPISVALPSEVTLTSQPTHENSTGPEFMIKSDSDVEDEQAVQVNQPLNSSSPFVLQSNHDPPYVAPYQTDVSETISTYIPNYLNQIITTIVSPPTYTFTRLCYIKRGM